MSQPQTRLPDDDAPIPEDRDVREYAGYLLQIAARYREAALDESLAALGLNATRCRVLGIIRRLKSCTMGELAFFSTVDRTTLTRVAAIRRSSGTAAKTVRLTSWMRPSDFSCSRWPFAVSVKMTLRRSPGVAPRSTSPSAVS